MLLEELKDWIIENLMVFSEKKQKNILVNKRLLDPYLIKKNFISKKNLIYETTSFLPDDRKFQERIFCIFNNVRNRKNFRT